MKTKIGFFGDSFCANKNSFSLKYTTYVSMLANYYDAEIVHLGKGGSSIGDLILLQLNPFIIENNVPDICVFTWTDIARIFNRHVRKLNLASVQEYYKRSKIWTAALEYYTHLYDHEFSELQYLALLEHVDNVILSQLPSKTKIVHLWSFGNPKEWTTNGFLPENINYHYTWKHGIEVRPSLMSFSMMDNPSNEVFNDPGPNHLSNKMKNDIVFELIKNAIDSQ